MTHSATRQISAGAIIFRREAGGAIKFLLLYHGRNYWNFPKGKLEEGERATAAFLREVEEETGLKRGDLKIISGFQATDRYMFSEGRTYYRRIHHKAYAEHARGTVLKIVIFYLVETKKSEVVISEEHDGFGWFSYHEALRISKYKNTQNIIKRAHEFIQKNLRGGAAHSQGPGRHLR